MAPCLNDDLGHHSTLGSMAPLLPLGQAQRGLHRPQLHQTSRLLHSHHADAVLQQQSCIQHKMVVGMNDDQNIVSVVRADRS